jgi:hypothetical protein
MQLDLIRQSARPRKCSMYFCAMIGVGVTWNVDYSSSVNFQAPLFLTHVRFS